MAINPATTDTVTIPQLDPLILALETYLVGANSDGKMGRFTANELADFIAPYISAIGASPFVTNTGSPLPNPISMPTAVTFVGLGTFDQTTGSDVTTTEELNLLFWSSNGVTGTWTIGIAISVDLTEYSKSVDVVKKSDLTLVGKQMFNSAAIVVGESVSFASGTVTVSATSARSPYIPVTGLQTYTLQGLFFGASKALIIQDAAGVLIPGAKYSMTSSPFTFTTPAGAARITFAVKSGSGESPNYALIQLEEGGSATAVVAYDNGVRVSMIGGKSIIAGNVPLIVSIPSGNYFDKDNIVYDKILSNGAQAIVDSPGSAISNRFYLKPATAHTIQGLVVPNNKILFQYDKFGVLIPSSAITVNAQPFTFTTHADFFSGILTVKTNNVEGTFNPDAIQIQPGTSATSVVPFVQARVMSIDGVPIISDVPEPEPVEVTDLPLLNLYPQIYSKLPLFTQRYLYGATVEDYFRSIIIGDSVWGRENHTSVGAVNPKTNPPVIVTEMISNYVWNNMIGGEKPVLERFDFGGYTEAGTWATVTVDATWSDSGTRDVTTRVSTTALASFSRAIPATYNYFNLVDRTDAAGSATVTVAITQGNGYVLARLDDKTETWVEANGFTFSQFETDEGSFNDNTIYQRRIQFKKTGSGLNAIVNITISKPNDATRILYWGFELITGKKYYHQLINCARGGRRLDTLNDFFADELVTRKPDFVIFELPLINMIIQDQTLQYSIEQVWDNIWGDRPGFENPNSVKAYSNDWANFNVLLILPQIVYDNYNADGTLKDLGSGYTGLDIHNAVKSLIIQHGDVAFISMNDMLVRASQVDPLFEGNMYTAMGASSLTGTTYTHDGVHLNDKGTKVCADMLVPIFDVNTF